jgi:hypothetical protein
MKFCPSVVRVMFQICTDRHSDFRPLLISINAKNTMAEEALATLGEGL